MQKNAHKFIILLLLTSFLSITASDSVDTPDNTELENDFTKVVKLVGKHIAYHVRHILLTLLTLPAIISKNSTEVPSFISKFTETAGDFVDKGVIIKVQYYLYTPVNPRKKFVMQLSHESFQKSTFNASLGTKFLIHGFSEFLPETSIIYDIKDQLLLKGNYNIIVVDWTQYSRASYDKAAINSAFVGFEIAKFINLLELYKEISYQSIHLIGHSLGCHTAGYIGKVIENIGRITALDAAGHIFEDLPSNLRITDTDADFVDAIHTHGSSSYSEGLGTLIPFGDIDFFPNGGNIQPGCRFGAVFLDVNKHLTLVNSFMDLIFCNHQRALYLFLESINECRFDSVMCHSYQDFKDGKCRRETSVVSSMGFHAKPIPLLPKHSTFYLGTTDSFPFCLDTFWGIK